MKDPGQKKPLPEDPGLPGEDPLLALKNEALKHQLAELAEQDPAKLAEIIKVWLEADEV